MDGTLPLVPITKCAKRDGRSLLYVGMVPERRESARTLPDRIVDNHFGGEATNSILRTNLGLLLEMQLGTAPKKIPPDNWGFEQAAEAHLSDWIAQNGAVNWVVVKDRDIRKNLENYLIDTYDLPLNSKGNRKHPFYFSLRALRRMADLRTETAKRSRSPTDWRYDAVVWIRNQAANLTSRTADRWEIARPTDQACETVIRLIDALGPNAPAPSALVATLSEGVELEWRRGNRVLSIEILPDATLESLKSEDGQPIAEERLDGADSRLPILLSWLDAA